MKRVATSKQSGLTQLSLFENHGGHDDMASQEVLKNLEANVCIEPKDVYERRRCVEMAEKLSWPAINLEPVGRWSGVMVPAGEVAWHAFLGQASDGTIGLIMLALHDRLDPLTHDSINEETGLHRCPVEVISQVEERLRRRMIHIAEALQWPRISYWATGKVEVIGPGEGVWRQHFVYGCAGKVSDAIGALERRLRGEPDRISRQQHAEEEDEG